MSPEALITIGVAILLAALLSQLILLKKASLNPLVLRSQANSTFFMIASIIAGILLGGAAWFGLFILALILWPPSY
jgi:hypothetical protein